MKSGKEKFTPLFIIVVALLVILASLFIFLSAKTRPNIITLAQKIVEDCSGYKYPNLCYEDKIPKSMESPHNLSMKASFDLIEQIQKIDKDYSYCHIVAHLVSAKEVEKSPENWQEVISQCPSNTCGNGCLHGAFQERYKKENLNDSELENAKPDLDRLCDKNNIWITSDLKQGSCYHALGHLLMYITRGNKDKSLDLCEEFVENPPGYEFTRNCFGGTFMQIYQPQDNEDLDLVNRQVITKEDVADLCKGYSTEKNLACFIQSWPLYRSELTHSVGIKQFCKQLPFSDYRECLENVFYILPLLLDFKDELIIQVCSEFPTEFIGSCLGSAASSLISEDYSGINKSIDFCKKASKIDKNDTCFSAIANGADFIFLKDSKEFRDLCGNLPERWKTICLDEK